MAKSYYTLNFPKKIREGDKVHIVAQLNQNPNEFRLILGVRCDGDKNRKLEPQMIALEFKTTFREDGIIKASTNWKTPSGWETEKIIDSDWISLKDNIDSVAVAKLSLTFQKQSIKIIDGGGNFIASFDSEYEIDRINRLQLWGSIQKMKKVTLEYNQTIKPRM